jgi:predicted phage-related endonuclease
MITSLGEPAHLEIKAVDFLAFRDGWQLEDEDEPAPPAHIELQVQHQMLVSGFSQSFIGVLVGGNTTHVIHRQRDEDVIAAIRTRISEFWSDVDAGREPPAVMPEDAASVIRLNAHAEPGKLLDATADPELSAFLAVLVAEYRQAKRDADNANEHAEVMKARILERIGDAEKVLVQGGSLSCGVVADSPPTVITADMIGQTYGGRRGYRRMQFFAKKGK